MPSQQMAPTAGDPSGLASCPSAEEVNRMWEATAATEPSEEDR